MRSESDSKLVDQRVGQRPEIRGQMNRQSERRSRQRRFDRPALDKRAGRVEYPIFETLKR